jgi:hypothetical protein
MTQDSAEVVPRSQVSLGVTTSLRGSLAQMANDRVMVIDYFASQRCGVVIGDLTGDFRDTPPGHGHLELSSVEGVRVFAESRLLAVLGEAGSTLRLGGSPFAQHLAFDLDRHERWIDFLEGPGVLARKRRLGWRRP